MSILFYKGLPLQVYVLHTETSIICTLELEKTPIPFVTILTQYIAANPPGFPGNLPDFETCPGIPDLKKKSRILKFGGGRKKEEKKKGLFLPICQGLR